MARVTRKKSKTPQLVPQLVPATIYMVSRLVPGTLSGVMLGTGVATWRTCFCENPNSLRFMLAKELPTIGTKDVAGVDISLRGWIFADNALNLRSTRILQNAMPYTKQADAPDWPRCQ